MHGLREGGLSGGYGACPVTLVPYVKLLPYNSYKNFIKRSRKLKSNYWSLFRVSMWLKVTLSLVLYLTRQSAPHVPSRISILVGCGLFDHITVTSFFSDKIPLQDKTNHKKALLRLILGALCLCITLLIS